MRARHKFTIQLPAMASVSVLMAAGVLVCSNAVAQTAPVPRLPRVVTPMMASAGRTDLPLNGTVVAGKFDKLDSIAIDPTNNKRTLTINQKDSAGILRWEKFDIGTDAVVKVNQISNTAVLLNKVDGSTSKTFIDGMLDANGHVYIYNPNGIVFGKTANINVNTLVATSLKIDDKRFMAGILSPNQAAVFAADGTLNTKIGDVVVEGDETGRASLNAATGGKIMLFAPVVTNNGNISAPDGQVVLAAGGSVLLSAPTAYDPGMRGLYVEVNSDNLKDFVVPQSATSVTNNGQISVNRGNATLVGLLVKQMGTVSATTSVNLNGSIYLHARDGATKAGSDPTEAPEAKIGGELILGSESKTEVALFDDKQTAAAGPDDRPFKQSKIDLSGKNISLQGAATIAAHSGIVNIVAKADPSTHVFTSDISPNTRVDISGESKIDVSGSKDASLAMESNVIEVQLLAELADNPVLRTSSLRGKKLNFDIRKGSKIADISKSVAKVEHNIYEFAATGGTVVVKSDGDVIQRARALRPDGSFGGIDVSGGQVNYKAGYVNTTKLTANGALFDDSTAPANQLYDGIVNLPNGTRNFEAAYSVGKDAGTVVFSAPAMALQGDLTGQVTPGIYQRDVAAASRPLGGKLIIGSNPIFDNNGKLDPEVDELSLFGTLADKTKTDPSTLGYRNKIVLGSPNTLAAATDPEQALKLNRLDINTNNLNNAGFTRLSAITAGDIETTAPVTLAAGGTLTLAAQGNITLNSDVSMPGGAFKAKAVNTLAVGSDTTFDLAGKWRNDSANANPARDVNGNPIGDIVTKGGSVDLSGTNVNVGDHVSIDVSGGAWLDSNRKLTKGDGGNITLKAKGLNSTVTVPMLRIGSGLTMSSYSLSKGGTLSLQASNVVVGGFVAPKPDGGTDGANSAPPVDPKQDLTKQYLWLPVSFFETGGFTKFDVAALRNFTVNAGSQITPRALNWQFKSATAFANAASGQMKDVANTAMLDLVGPNGGRSPTSLSFSAPTLRTDSSDVGNLVFGNQAKISADPKASVSLSAGLQLSFDGTIVAPGGAISLGLLAASEQNIYDSQRSIVLGSSAHLISTGTSDLLYTASNGITTGEVLGGGSVSLDTSNAGYIVVQQPGINGASGATIDVSGTVSDPVSLMSGKTATSPAKIASAGGDIKIKAREGIFFDGTLAAKGGDASAQGGSLSVVLDRGSAQLTNHYPDDHARALTIFDGNSDGKNTIKTSIVGREGQGWISTRAFSKGGFDRLNFKSQDVIALSSIGSFDLNARVAITLDAPNLDVTNASNPSKALNTVNIKSAYVQMGNSDYRYQDAPLGATGDAAKNVATINVNATTIDLIGHSVVQGSKAVNLEAAEDIRFVGASKATPDKASTKLSLDVLLPKGEFDVTGSLNLKSREAYVTTLSQFNLNAIGSGSNITFQSNGASHVDPLSAGGILAVNAKNIVQSGNLLAPFGQIQLNASDSLKYTDGSLTSVAGKDIVPFGRIENGRDWVYDFGGGNEVAFKINPGNDGNLPEMSLPEKVILSKGANISTAKGALLDLSGGGQLYGYEFTPGSNGTRDVLANNGSAPTVWAINPNFNSSVAPRDFQYGQDAGLKAGDSVYLSGVARLKAGTYTLLPAHYALLPGGMSISLASNSRDMSAANNVVNLDGSMTVAGQRTVFGAGDKRTSGFVVSSGKVVRSKSEYQEYNLTDYFTKTAKSLGVAAPMLSNDGGHVQFDASKTLAIAGKVLLNADKDGRRGIADISAPDIVVVSDASQAVPDGSLKLVVSDLTAMNADSLLLGGLRETQSDGSHLIVGANNVTVKNDKDHALSGSEILLAARDSVTVGDGAVVKAEGTVSQVARDILVQSQDSNGNDVGTDGALLRVSGGAAVSVVRNQPLREKGSLIIGTGAVVGATGSAYLDATFDSQSKGKLDLAAGSALGLGAKNISLGSDIPTGTDSPGGLQFDTNALLGLSTLSALELNSYNKIDLYGNVNLGSATMSKLSLRGSGIQAHGSLTDPTARLATFTADTVRLDGGNSFTPDTSNVAGNLTVKAKDIEFGNNNFAINGFADVKLVATREARAVGTGIVSAESNLRLEAGRVTAYSSANAGVQAGKQLVLTTVTTPDTPISKQQLGGRLVFKGNTVTSDANIITPAGQISFQASNGVDITGGTVNASGAAVNFGSTTAYAQGGQVIIDSGAGNTIIRDKATIDVSAVGASAGTVTIKSSNGSNAIATNNGTLKGDAVAGIDGKAQTQGSFVLDVDQLASADQFNALNAKLNTGGFTESRQFRVRNGDVALDTGKTLTAHDVIVSADNGSISIGGDIDATGGKGGSIQLFASQADASGTAGKVNIYGSAILNASANPKVTVTTEAGSLGDGGRVLIGTGSADGSMQASTSGGSSISIGSGAQINVSGSGSGSGGSVTFRAPRVGNDGGNDVAINQLAGTIVGSRDTTIEAYKTYTTSKVSELVDKKNADGTYSNLQVAGATGTKAGTPAGTVFDESKSFANNANAIQSRLGTVATVRSGIDIRSNADLLVSVNESSSTIQNRGWDLSAWRFNGTPITLSLRAQGDLTISGSISDGFVKPIAKTTTEKLVSMPDWVLDKSASASYRLVGGADFNAANPLAVIANSNAGDVKVQFARTKGTATDTPVALVRTGTGSIDVAAGRNVVLGSLANTADAGNIIGATIYTAGLDQGISTKDGTFVAPTNQNNQQFGAAAKTNTPAQFSNQGGAISIFASNDVIGAPVPQLINNWLFRQGRSTTDDSGNVTFDKVGTATLNTAWWTRFDYFDQGIATFAGGDVSIVAAKGNVKDVSASVATNAYMPGATPTTLIEHGGGDLTVKAGNDILGGTFYVQKGVANISADGSIAEGTKQVGSASLKTVLALGDAQVNVNAGKDVAIESVINPTLVFQSIKNLGVLKSIGSEPDAKKISQLSNFSTYSDQTAVNLTALSGNVVLSNNKLALIGSGGSDIIPPGYANSADVLYSYLPSQLNAAALTGDVNAINGFSMAGSSNGQLNLLAGNSVHLASGQDASSVVMLDIDTNKLSPYNAPRWLSLNFGADSSLLTADGNASAISSHTNGGLHANDPEPGRVIALKGDITGNKNLVTSLNLPKSAEISAGRDIKDLGFQIQNNNQSDVTKITAGRDFIDSTIIFNAGSPVQHVISGQGRVDFFAGRNFDLGDSNGVVTRGSLDNPYLPFGGAAINIQAATTTVDYASFARNYVAVTDLSKDDQTALQNFVAKIKPEASTSPATAWDAFKTLTVDQQTEFVEALKTALNDLFFAKLVESSKIKDLKVFDQQIASLYPNINSNGGDINLFGSQVRTDQGGAIDLFAPGGSVYAGLANQPSYLIKSASNLGTFTIRGGEIRSLVKTDFSVNQGRVFSLGGGDITLISQYGDLSAGKGTRTASSSPPPVITTDAKGNTVIDISGSISGSGIATLKTNPSVADASVYVIAPRGTFDAGDAGVRSTGSVDINAQVVLNAGNIVAAGTISGAPAIDTGSLNSAVPAGAGAQNVSDIAKDFNKLADTSAGTKATTLSVDVLGYGLDCTDPKNAAACSNADDNRKKN